MEFTEDFDPESISKKLITVKISNDLSLLKSKEIEIINLLIKCSKIIDDIYLMQSYKDNLKIKDELLKLDNKKIYDYFKIMGGPFDHFNNDEPYITGIKKTLMAGLYPEDLNNDEWNNFLFELDKNNQNFISPYSIIIRNDGKLNAIPYNEYFKDKLLKCSILLEDAAKICENSSLRSYLNSLSDSFKNNDFRIADINFVLLKDSKIIPLLGPHEFYLDKFLGCKASFTALISIKNPLEFKKTEIILSNLNLLYERLPIPPHYKKQKRGEFSQIEIVDLIYSTGDIRIPIHAAAFNLPNSENIKSEYGSKKVLIYNIMKLKFDSILVPISKLILDTLDKENVNFNAYFYFVVMHEISHELGIGFIKDNDGKMKEVSYYLKDLYTIIEEAKADVMGIYSLIYLIKTGLINDCSVIEICTTYLINLIRDIRFGIDNAHGMASLIQINFLTLQGIFIPIKNNSFITVDLHKLEKAIEQILTIILTLQGEGNYEKTKKFIKKYSDNISLNLNIYLEKIEKLPIDILPVFTYDE